MSQSPLTEARWTGLARHHIAHYGYLGALRELERIIGREKALDLLAYVSTDKGKAQS